ncbi:putative permease [Silvibacterium bohemicum]|uniref:Putative permease n=1 Tax=Silvibacterium bohemicum TaxID=1577686 RepID=A0A841K4E8_9BACT|nr:ABC transporter permease [Silvibacterium bohemicum]MBB6146031.1 putative permease [Silvibacterium bohemicum]
MRKLRALWFRLLGMFGVDSDEADFAAELENDIDLRIEDGMRIGLSREEARRRVLIQMGGIEQTRQAYRERRGLPVLEDFLHDVKHGLRMMSRNPSFTAVAVLTLALGIGTSTTAFTWIDNVLLRPLRGVSDPGRLVALESVTPGGDFVPNSYPDYRDFRDHLTLLDGIAVTRPAAFSIGQKDHAERVSGEYVSGNFFAVLGVKPEVGRMFAPDEYGDKPGAFPVAVISDRYWRSHFGADPSIVGKTIRVDQHELTVAGVADPAFHGSMAALAFDLWVPYMQRPVLEGVEPWMIRNRQDRAVLGIARLKRGVSVEQAREELALLAARMAKADADTNEGMSATLLPLSKSPHGPQGLLAGPLQILMGVCVLLLAIVCVNVANLLLARATVREKEFSTRLALGSGRWRLVRQVLTESLLLSAMGATLGAVAAHWMTHALRLFMPPVQLSLVLDTGLHLRVVLFTAGICVLATVAAGVVPALQSGRTELSARMNEGGRSGAAGRRRHRLGSALVAAEVALALVALVCAGLFARSFEQTRQIDPGFDARGVLLSQFSLATNGYDLEQRKEFCRRLADKMSSAPGVVDVAYSDGVPLGFEPSWWEDLQIEGYVPSAGENMKMFRNVISPGYLSLLKIPMMDGRQFTEHDDEKSQPVMIVNQTFARRFFAGRNPIGRRIHGWGEWFTVVGVVKDSKYHYLAESFVPYIYVPFRQIYRADMNLAFYVRSQGDPGIVLAALRSSVRQLDPSVTVFDAVPMSEFIGASLYPQRVAASLLTVLGGLSVLLAAIGLYSVMAYSVAQRTPEIGIRMALGARPVDVLSLVVRQGMRLTVAGLLAGAVVALGVTRSLAAVSFTNSAMGAGAKLLRVSSTDPLVYLLAAAFLSAVSALAAYVPARRAASVDPMTTLRME